MRVLNLLSFLKLFCMFILHLLCVKFSDKIYNFALCSLCGMKVCQIKLTLQKNQDLVTVNSIVNGKKKKNDTNHMVTFEYYRLLNDTKRRAGREFVIRVKRH